MSVKFTPNKGYSVENIAEFVSHIGNRQAVYFPLRSDRPFKLRSLAGFKVEPQAHCVGNRKDVGKENGRIEAKTTQRLQSYFAGKLRIGANTHKVASFGTHLAILRQIAPRLAHDPDWRPRHRLLQKRAQEKVILQPGRHQNCAAMVA